MNLAVSIHNADRMKDLIRRIEPEVGRAVRKTAHDIKREAQDKVPVDTGALKNSIHVLTDRMDVASVAQAVEASMTAAAKATTKAGVGARRFMAGTQRPGRLEAIVAVGMEYGRAVEEGTHNTAAQPYLMPAVEATAGPFRQAVIVAINRAATLANVVNNRAAGAP